jgi:hypothetical protein
MRWAQILTPNKNKTIEIWSQKTTTVPPGTSLIAAGTAEIFFGDFLIFFSETTSLRNTVLCIGPKFSHGVSLFAARKLRQLSAKPGDQSLAEPRV